MEFPLRSRMAELGFRPVLILPVLLVQTACINMTSVQRYPVEPLPAHPAPASEPTASIPSRIETPPPAKAPPPPEPAPQNSPPAATPPAVLALLGDAESNLQSGDFEDAASSLERAIRIQPRNPRLWHALAEVRLKQQQPILAEDLAKKSTLHAKGDAALIRANWAIIAEARRQKGDDPDSAADAQRKAAE